MKILVTGSSGHLGEALMRTLQPKGYQAIGIDLIPSDFTHFTGCISDKTFVQKHMKGVDIVLHSATLHKPHVVTHSYDDFVNTNITGTLNLLEAASSEGVRSFIFTSTTSAFGSTLTPPPGAPAVWVTEELPSTPKNIYGVTKTAAEDLCQLFYKTDKLPILILRTSRFFPEEDDNKNVRDNYSDANSKVNEFLYRRVEIEDVVSAHLLAMEKGPSIGFGKYIISATSPFTPQDLDLLGQDPHSVVKRLYPDYDTIYKKLGWKMFPRVSRVYVNEKAQKDLGWQPKFDFGYILQQLKAGSDYKSQLSNEIGSKGYHEQEFKEGPYPV